MISSNETLFFRFEEIDGKEMEKKWKSFLGGF
jgi:hypothetical protein